MKYNTIKGSFNVNSSLSKPNLDTIFRFKRDTNIQHRIVLALWDTILAGMVVNSRRKSIHGRQNFKAAQQLGQQSLHLVHGELLGCNNNIN